MSAKDLIKKSIYEQFAGNTGLSFNTIFSILLISLLIGIYIFVIYKIMAKSQFYSKDFNITIPGMTVIVASIMIAMQSNLIVSLGMVGALSIVRFRTAIKNPLDLLYLFWAISMGIISGVGLFFLAIVTCGIMTLLLIGAEKMHFTKYNSILIIRYNGNIASDITTCITSQIKNFTTSSVASNTDYNELIIEIDNIKNIELLVETIRSIDGVSYVNYVMHHGDYRS